MQLAGELARASQAAAPPSTRSSTYETAPPP